MLHYNPPTQSAATTKSPSEVLEAAELSQLEQSACAHTHSSVSHGLIMTNKKTEILRLSLPTKHNLSSAAVGRTDGGTPIKHRALVFLLFLPFSTQKEPFPLCHVLNVSYINTSCSSSSLLEVSCCPIWVSSHFWTC